MNKDEYLNYSVFLKARHIQDYDPYTVFGLIGELYIHMINSKMTVRYY